ncbi:MAG: pyridine nucleotide-disulfide oxidoreductase, partial [Polyangiaceae bacterium]
MGVPELKLGIPGFSYADLFEPARLDNLHEAFQGWFQEHAPDARAQFEAYRACGGVGMTPEAVSEALLAAAPHVSTFLGRLFSVDKELYDLRSEVRSRDPLWRFKREFAKKRVLGANAGKGWAALGLDFAAAEKVSRTAVWSVLTDPTLDDELAFATGTMRLFEVDDVARKAAKGGGVSFTDELKARAKKVGDALRAEKLLGETGMDDIQAVTFALEAVEACLHQRRQNHHDPAHRWDSLHQPHTLDHANLVQIRRPDPKLPELFVGPEEERRERGSFLLTDPRGAAREVEREIDYCIFCHNRDKDSCSKGLRDPKTKEVKKNPLGVALEGCPLEEKISEMHMMRGEGDVLAALALVCI